MNVIKYLFTVLSKFAVIVQFHVRLFPHVFVQPLNVYVYCASADVGVAVTVVHPIVTVLLLIVIVEP